MVSSSLFSVLCIAISHQSINAFLSPSLHQSPLRYNNDFISLDNYITHDRVQSTSLAVSTEQSTTQLTNNNQELNKEKEPSYTAILKAIDYDHQREATESYPYLVSESIDDIPPFGDSLSVAADGKLEGREKNVYQFPATPILNENTVNVIRNAAQTYFNTQRNNNNNNDGGSIGMALGIDRVDLTDLINMDGGHSGIDEQSIVNDLNKALETIIYPTVREGWYDHDAFTSSTSSHQSPSTSTNTNAPAHEQQQVKSQPVLTVTSASIFANGGYNGAKPSMTTFERDAGLFVVHVDLGNKVDSVNSAMLEEAEGSDEVMGGIFMESLIPTSTSTSTDTTTSQSYSNTRAIVGPIFPGQGIIHKSNERTAALSVPSNLHELGQQGGEEEREGLDCTSRSEIIKCAERNRHYALRLVLTTKHLDTSSQQQYDTQTDEEGDTPQYEAPAEERSYRLRNYAKFREDRVKYVTLAGLIDVTSHENYLWLGFDYLARMTNDDDNQSSNEGEVDLHEQLSYVNKAIYNLEKATRLCQTDARVYFQLATALKAKMDVEQRLLLEQADGNEDNTNVDMIDETAYLTQISKALEQSAHLESGAVKAGVNGIQDLTICLNALADTSARTGQYNKALSVIDKWAECGSIRSSLAVEDQNVLQQGGYDIPSYEYITSADDKKVAVRTVGDIPVFSTEDIEMLTDAANRHFARAAGVQTSRYTMQYEGNSEVHLDDLCATDPILKTRIDTILNDKIYPLVRDTIGQESDNHIPPQGSLCVYDSILVRYNGEKARAAGRVGASQPLHQDGGIYSVNIALNAHQDQDVNGFTGGGTFFEALTVGDDDEYIQRPSAPGHAIVHKTTQRHAGAPTTSGIRDILVIFLTARRPKEAASVDENTWGIESAMRLQSVAKEMKRDKLLPFLRLARDIDPTNSDILYWLGVHLMQGDSNDPSDERWNEICQGVESLQYSAVLNPADARVHYHLGMAISTRHKYAMRTRRAHLLPPPKEAAETLIEAIETAMRLEAKCEKAGCKNDINIAAGYLCLGDFMARLQDPDRAIVYLNQVEEHIDMEQDGDTNWVHSMLDEVNSMLEYCRNESMKKKEASLVAK